MLQRLNLTENNRAENNSGIFSNGRVYEFWTDLDRNRKKAENLSDLYAKVGDTQEKQNDPQKIKWRVAIDFTTPSGEWVWCSNKTTDKQLNIHDKLKHEVRQVEAYPKPEKRWSAQFITKDAEHKRQLTWNSARQNIGAMKSNNCWILPRRYSNAIPTSQCTGKILSPATQTVIVRPLWAINLQSVDWCRLYKIANPKRIRWINEKEAELIMIA